MHVQVAPDGVPGDELGQGAAVGQVDLAAVLAQFGDDVLQLQHLVDVLLALPAQPFHPFVDAVLVDLQPPVLGDLAQGDVVRLGAGKVVQGGAVRVGLHGPQVDVQPLGELDGRARGPLHDDAFDVGQVDENVHDVAVHGGRRDDVDVLDGVAAAADAAGDRDGVDALGVSERLQHGEGDRFGDAEAVAFGCELFLLQSGGDGFDELGAEPFEGLDLARFKRLLQVGEGADVQFGEEVVDPFRSQPRDLQQRFELGRDALLERFEGFKTAGFDDLADLLRQLLADAGQGGQVFTRDHHFGQGVRQRLDGARGVAVGADAEGVRFVDLEQVGDLQENGGDGVVADLHGSIIAILPQ